MRGKPRGYRKKRRSIIHIKRTKPSKYVDTLHLQQVKKKIIETNKRIELIEKKYGKGTWAIKSLSSEMSIKLLNMINKSGKVKRISGKNKLKLMAVNKALDKFLKKKTSTIKGIKDAINKAKQTLKEENIDLEEDIDNYDAETLFDLMGDYDFRWLADLTEEKSELMAIVQTARYEDWNISKWIEEVKENFIYFNDKDTEDRVKRLYNNLIVNRKYI